MGKDISLNLVDCAFAAIGLKNRLFSRSKMEIFMPGSLAPELMRQSEEVLGEAIDSMCDAADEIVLLRAENKRLLSVVEDLEMEIRETAEACND